LNILFLFFHNVNSINFTASYMRKKEETDNKIKQELRTKIFFNNLFSIFIIIASLFGIIFLIKFESDGNVLSFKIDDKEFLPLFLVVSIVTASMFKLLDKTLKEKTNITLDEKDSTLLNSIEISLVNKKNIDDLKASKIEKQLNENITESKNNADRLLSRSNTCLVVGCIISILGVFVFYLLNLGTEYNSLEISQQLFTLLPRFGILFFIEYVAFFFLKQYRILMEEYRYYEAIKRDRQNLLSIYYLVDKYKDEKEILELMNNYIDKHSAEIPKYSGDNRVKMEKSLNEDMDLISKIIKMIQVIKSTDKSKE
jgi:hypothetical protein